MTLALDSWIVLAWLKNQEPGAGMMASLWEWAAAGKARLVMSIVNLGEVYYLAAKSRDESYAQTVIDNLRQRRVEIVPAPNDLVLEAAALKARYPISYADAFAAATAMQYKAALATGDPDFRSLESDGLRLHWAGTA